MMDSIVQQQLREGIKGVRQVLRALSERQLCKIVVAEDIDRQIYDDLIGAAQQANVPYVTIPTRAELGELAGIEVSCSVVGIPKQ